MRFKTCFFMLLCSGALLLSGCRSTEYYQDRAVERARKFLLENAPELTIDQIYYVKYNPPVLLVGKGGLGGPPPEFRMKRLMTSHMQQICVTWVIPGIQEYYMVYGVSSGRMDYWYPNRLLRKSFLKADIAFLGARNAAVSYAIANLYRQLSVGELNLVRFSYPWVYETKFELSANPTGKLSAEETAKIEKNLKKSKQFSLVWKLPDGKRALVFCGVAKDESLVGWGINFAGFFDVGELKEGIVREIRTPETPDVILYSAPPEKNGENEKSKEKE